MVGGAMHIAPQIHTPHHRTASQDWRKTSPDQDQLRSAVFFYLYTKSTRNDQFQLNLRKLQRKMFFTYKYTQLLLQDVRT